MTPFQKFSRSSKVRTYLMGGAIVFGLSGSMIFTSCSSEPQYTTEEKVELTKGLITEVEEVKAGQFKITDETVVPTRDDSRIIALYLDGARDTFTLDEAMLVEANDGRRRGFSSVLMGGMMGYMMGRSLSSPVNPTAYKNQDTYNRVNKTTGSTLQNTAKRTTVRKPVRSKSGYGSKSSRSYGG